MSKRGNKLEIKKEYSRGRDFIMTGEDKWIDSQKYRNK